MLLLSQPNAIIQVTSTNSAAGVAVLNAHVSYVDEATSNTYAPVGANTPVAVSSPVTIVGSPASGYTRNVKFLSITNTDTVNATTVQVSHFDGAVASQLTPPVPLAAGATLTYNDGQPWILYGPGMTTATLISDGLHGTVAVKPANTPATVTDIALVMAVSPGTPLPVGSNIIGYSNPSGDLRVLANNATITTTTTYLLQNVGGKEITLGIDISGTVSGTTPSMSIAMQEVDPVNTSTLLSVPGQNATFGPYTSTGHTNYVRMFCYSSAVLVTLTITGTTPSFGGVNLWATAKPPYEAVGFARARVAITFNGAASTSDTMLLMNKFIASSQASGFPANTVVPTSGSILRITSMTFSVKDGAAVGGFATFNVRTGSGTITTSSNSEFCVSLPVTGAASGNGSVQTIEIPEGIEFLAGQSLGVSAVGQATTNILEVSLNGYEY